MHVRTLAAAPAVLALVLAACASKEGRSAMEHVEVTEKGVAVKAPEVPAVEKPALSLEKMAPSGNYPTDKCIVTGEALGPTPVVYSWGGREVQFCCGGCAAKFVQSPDTYLSKLAK